MPGIIQTAYRAELYAIMTALRFALKHRCAIRIWTDCQSAIAAFATHVRDGLPVRANSKHCDLLRSICQLASAIGPGCVEVLKVPAHVSQASCSNDLERWLVCGNEIADGIAKSANVARPAATWALWSAYSDQLDLCTEQASLARAHILAVSKFWNESASMDRPVVPQVSRPLRLARAQPEPFLTWPAELVLTGPSFRRFFGLDLFRRVSAWFSNIRASGSPIQWISFHQLFISFQKRQGPVHVSKIGGVWKVETGEVASLANHMRMGVRVKFFRLMPQQFLKDTSVHFTTATVRPASHWISCFKGSLAIDITHDEHNFVEGFFGRPAA